MAILNCGCKILMEGKIVLNTSQVAPPFTLFVPRSAVARARNVSSLARPKACGMPGGRSAGGLPRHLLTHPFRSTVANEAYETLHPVVLDAQEHYAHLVPGRLDLASPRGASRCAVRDSLEPPRHRCRPMPFLYTPNADIEHGVGCPWAFGVGDFSRPSSPFPAPVNRLVRKRMHSLVR